MSSERSEEVTVERQIAWVSASVEAREAIAKAFPESKEPPGDAVYRAILASLKSLAALKARNEAMLQLVNDAKVFVEGCRRFGDANDYILAPDGFNAAAEWLRRYALAALGETR